MTYNAYNPNGYTKEDWSDYVDEGWKPLMRGLQELAGDVILIQVKEKFGALRIYWKGEDVKFQDYVNVVSRVSAHTCEVCGKPGSIGEIKKGWFKAVCDEHLEG